MTTSRRDAWQAALQIITALRTQGHVALLAGGCVRDRLLNRVPKDYDVATDATPDRVREIFPRARSVGAKFGVILVHKYGHNIEVATFRTDGPYSDGRHPESVTFGTEFDDARRRDFTINGLFYDPIGERVIDHVSGRDDLDHGIIRTIGDPEERFAEDHLRMLRAVRFATRLGFEIEPQTAGAIKRLAQDLKTISPERVWQELEQVLADPEREKGWALLLETGLRKHLSAHWAQVDSDDLVQDRLAALPGRMIDAGLGLAALFAGASKAAVTKSCDALRLSNRMARRVGWLVAWLESAREEHALELADLKLLMANVGWPQLLDLLQADLSATGGDPGAWVRLRNRASSIDAEDVAPPPLLTGDDLSTMGMSPGPRMGELLEALYRAQLNDQIRSRDAATTMAREWMEA